MDYGGPEDRPMHDEFNTSIKSNVPTTPKKLGSVSQNVQYLHNELDLLHDRVSILADTLQPILSPSPTAGDEQGQPDANSDLASRISNAVRMVNGITQRLTYLTDSIDL